MTLGATVAGTLPLLQAQAESLMTDTCTITRAAGNGGLNPATGGYDPQPGVTVYSGKCRVKPRITRGPGDQVEAGERPVQVWPYTVSVPMSVTTVKVDDLVTITATANDDGLVDATLIVKDVARGSQISARRLGCVDEVTPSG